MPPFLTKPWLLVCVGGAIGSLLRYYAGVTLGPRPMTTFAVNISGAFLIGILAAVTDDHRTRLLLGTGVLGGFTTFSTWQLEAYAATHLEGGWKGSMWILFGSLAAGCAACWIGHTIGERLRYSLFNG